MAEETNVASSEPIASDTEMAHTEQDNGGKTTEIAGDNGNSEPLEEGADQEEVADGMSNSNWSLPNIKLTSCLRTATKINGDTSHATNDKPSTSAPDTQDSEMQEAADTGNAQTAESNPVIPPINGTPAPSKRVSTSGSSRKKSSAVPEHKSKKLNKKKSRPLTNLNAQPGEYYIARMKGHPPWPSVVCDEDMLPQSLLTTRPVTAALEDGTFKRTDYADGGKRVHERTFPIMFL